CAVDQTTGGPIRPAGTSALTGLTRGDYTLRAQPNGMTGDDAETAMLRIAVTGEDIADLQLVASKPSVATGRIIVDPGATPPRLMLAASPVQPMMMFMGGGPGRMNDD